MAPKRDREDDAQVPHVKKVRGGFKVGPDNLPDGTWRRKVIKIKKDLIHNAKVKKSYAKVKARTTPPTPAAPSASTIVIQAPSEPVAPIHSPSPPPQSQPQERDQERELHPSRQAMLSAPSAPPTVSVPRFSAPPKADGKARAKRPGYFDKAKEEAVAKRLEAEARRAEFERRDGERRAKTISNADQFSDLWMLMDSISEANP
ncbi:hypothetical protein ACLOAV_006622 [Pseudogymnoascus australis]